jgi:hypothetical protein
MKKVVTTATLLLGLLSGLLFAPAAADTGNGTDFAESTRLSVFGLTADQRLVRFRVNRPQLLQEMGQVSGLQGSDPALVGIDFRVQDGKLYGVGKGGGIYTLDTNTAVATLVAQLSVPLKGSFFGVDFNPAANALRIISNTGQNLRHPFAGPQAGQTQTDDPLDYPPATPLNTSGPTATGLSGAAYTNNDLDLDTNTGTTLYDIDTARNQVAIQSPPNNGSLVPTGNLSVDPDTPVGFDIYTRLQEGAAVENTGFAALVVKGVSGFYQVNLQTGQAKLIGNFKDRVIGIASPLEP